MPQAHQNVSLVAGLAGLILACKAMFGAMPFQEIMFA